VGVRGTWLVSTRKILVVEDGYLFAEEIAANLRGFGMEPVGPVGHLDEACRMAREKAVDGAVLDVMLHDAASFAVAAILRARGIPFVFLTGYEEQQIPLDFRAAPVLRKPFEASELEEAINSLPSARWHRDSPTQPSGDVHGLAPDQPLGEPRRKQ
jgi:two-component system, response regulator PdtaR